jgi:predicted RNA-binding Zn ribbon-like protein
VTDAGLVVAIANARAARRPAHAPRAVDHDALGDAGSATELLGRPVQERDLVVLRAIHAAIGPVVDAMIDGIPVPVDPLNDLAAREPAIHALEVGTDRRLRPAIRPASPSAAGELLLEVIRELAELDPSRLRRCERPECRLVFYDTTRSATRRWHAESPCGLRERQRRHRARSRA